MNSLKELKKEAEDSAQAFEQLREEWRLDRQKVTEQILATTITTTPDALPPATLRRFLNTRVATSNTPDHIGQAMAGFGIEPHLERLLLFKERLATLGVSPTALYQWLANNMELRRPDHLEPPCPGATLAERWLHDNHGRYNRVLKDIIERHNYRPRLRTALWTDGTRATRPVTSNARREELATFLYANRDEEWYLPTPA